VTDDSPPAQITVFIDATHAKRINGQAGVVLEAGPRIGQDGLRAILCHAITEITAVAEDGTPNGLRAKNTEDPTGSSRAIIHRDGNTCRADGCASTNRLQIHHMTPWSEGRPTNPENLITLCWYHTRSSFTNEASDPTPTPNTGASDSVGSTGDHPTESAN
jgi:hypothetical protein